MKAQGDPSGAQHTRQSARAGRFKASPGKTAGRSQIAHIENGQRRQLLDAPGMLLRADDGVEKAPAPPPQVDSEPRIHRGVFDLAINSGGK